MSYILDALRRADSERTRGAVPDIHAQPVPVLSDDGATPRRARPWMWLAIGLALVVLGLVAWTMLDSEPPRDFAQAPVPAPPAPMAPATAPPAATTPIPPTLPSGEPAPSVVAPVPTPAPAPPAATVAPPVKPPAARPVARPFAPPADAARARAKEVKPAAASAPEPRIYTRNELPEDVRRELPALVVGGSVYSEHAPSRMLILNGQVFREGDQLAPNLKLEQIKLKGAVLRYKEYRFGLAY